MLFALWQIEIARAEGLLHGKGEAHLPGIPVEMPGLIREGAVRVLAAQTLWGPWVAAVSESPHPVAE